MRQAKDATERRVQLFVRPVQHRWGVSVSVNGEDVLTIESNSLCGKSDLSPMELDAIRTAANHLLAFAGQPTRHRMNQLLSEL